MASGRAACESRLARSRLKALLPFAALLAAAAQGPHCLDSAIPAADRKLLSDPDEGDIPLRLWTLDWASASLMESIFRTLAEEVLGYVVETSGLGSASSSGIFAVAACQRPNNFHADQSCHDGGMQHHLVLEVWMTAALDYAETVLRERPAKMPLDIGDTGYIGMETLFVLGNALTAAYGQEGLPLNYYRSYDPTWHDSYRYFDSMASVSSTTLKPCEDTLMMNEVEMDNYIRYSGDIGGVVLQDGAWRARCWDGHWWLAPACRNSPERCVPFITGGNGWFLYAIMSVSAKFGMPAAVATAATWGDYLSIPRRSGVLLYWWTPDVSFIDLDPEEIIFPRFDPMRWSQGDKAGVAREVLLHKWAYRGLPKLAPQLLVLAENLQLSKDQVDHLLLQVRTTGRTPAQVACTWLREHSATWDLWLPRPTACVEGQGLVNASGGFVEARAEAVSCTWCMAGYSSSPVVDEFGLTHACTACAPGRAQDERASTECTRCNVGYHASEPAMLRCTRCPQGRYQRSEGSSACEACAPPKTTDGMGSTHASECVCPEGTYKGAAPDDTCHPCPPGFRCPLGSDAANVPCDSSGPAAGGRGPWPSPLPLHVAFCSEPTRAYRCLFVDSCEGGGMGRCGPHMSGIACGLCSKGYFHRQGRCHECWLRSLGVWLAVLGSAGPFVFLVVHALAGRRADMRYSFIDTLLCMAYIILVEAQVVAVMAKCNVAIEGSFNFVVVYVSRVLDTLSGMSDPTCFAGLDFTGSFVFNALRPLTGLLIYFFTYGCAELAGRLYPRYHMNWNVGLSTYGGLYLIFFIGIAEQAVSLWHCYEHPDGTSSSMYDAPHILCDSPSWRDLVAMAVVACLIFCAGFLALVCYSVYVAPMQMASAAFRTRWRFLFVRFRPSTWWWGMLLMIRGLWFCLSTTIFDMGFRQLLWVQVMLVTYVLSCCGFLPWRSMAVTALDICTHMALIMLCSMFLAHTTTETSGFVTFVLLFSGPMVFAGVLLITLATHHFARPTKSETWELRAEKLRQVLYDASHSESLGFVLSRLPLADLSVIVLAKQLLQAELLGHQPMLHRTFSPAMICTNASFYGHCRPAFRTDSFANGFESHLQDLEDPTPEAGAGSAETWVEHQNTGGSARATPAGTPPQAQPRRLMGWGADADVTDAPGLSFRGGAPQDRSAHDRFVSVVPTLAVAPKGADVRTSSKPAPSVPSDERGGSWASHVTHPSQVCEEGAALGSQESLT